MLGVEPALLNEVVEEDDLGVNGDDTINVPDFSWGSAEYNRIVGSFHFLPYGQRSWSQASTIRERRIDKITLTRTIRILAQGLRAV